MIRLRENAIVVEGPLNQQSVPELLAQGEALVAGGADSLDLSAVSAVDSAGVAAVLGWIRAARGAGRQLTIVAVPAAFRSLAELYGLSGFLFDSHAAEPASHA